MATTQKVGSGMRFRTVRVVERASEWLCLWGDGLIIAYDSAAECASRIALEGTEDAYAGVSSAITVTWEPSTAIGRAAVRVLTGTKKRTAKPPRCTHPSGYECNRVVGPAFCADCGERA